MSPWANYTFRVTVVNKVGPLVVRRLRSGVSNQCETPPEVPFKNPDSVSFTGNYLNDLVIYWEVINCYSSCIEFCKDCITGFSQCRQLNTMGRVSSTVSFGRCCTSITC